VNERRLIALVTAGAAATALAAIVVWLATLHGAWLLGLPGRRSAVVAWLRGLQATARRPVAGLSTLLVWVVPALLVSAVVPLLGVAFEGVRGGPLLFAVGLLVSLARAFCWVGLFCSFEYLQTADGKKAVQEIMHTQEAWRQEDGAGEPPER
jgi:hypothetical protein